MTVPCPCECRYPGPYGKAYPAGSPGAYSHDTPGSVGESEGRKGRANPYLAHLMRRMAQREEERGREREIPQSSNTEELRERFSNQLKQ
ncbi:hypothetical protein KIPB_016529, partial [Kipferlia bialata]|eukprot:g16529.t1